MKIHLVILLTTLHLMCNGQSFLQPEIKGGFNKALTTTQTISNCNADTVLNTVDTSSYLKSGVLSRKITSYDAQMLKTEVFVDDTFNQTLTVIETKTFMEYERFKPALLHVTYSYDKNRRFVGSEHLGDTSTWSEYTNQKNKTTVHYVGNGKLVAKTIYSYHKKRNSTTSIHYENSKRYSKTKTTIILNSAGQPIKNKHHKKYRYKVPLPTYEILNSHRFYQYDSLGEITSIEEFSKGHKLLKKTTTSIEYDGFLNWVKKTSQINYYPYKNFSDNAEDCKIVTETEVITRRLFKVE